MASSGQYARIHEAFSQDGNLRKRIFATIDELPQTAVLFEAIAKYHESHRGPVTNGTSHVSDEPLTKKRKLEEDNLPLRANASLAFRAKDVSFSIPQRKKLHLNFVWSATSGYVFQATNTSTDNIEFKAAAGAFTHILRLPVPEKAQKQYNYCMLRVDGEPIVFTVNDGPLKDFSVDHSALTAAIGDSGPELVLERVLNAIMHNSSVKVTCPDEEEFVAAVPESHRKGEKAYHVKAFRGSKDGFLFFLENGIFSGFKKPLHFFDFDSIESISYTSVLQRTFNMVISYKPTTESESEEIEFSMIDQADFAGIDAFIKRHELQDASMADARRAKRLNINKPRGETKTDDGANGAEDNRTELQKAEAELEDAEDEEEEDYDPGSEGESEGSGSDTDDDEEDAHGVNGGGDVVEEELGSEAQDVEVDPDDEDQL